MKNENADKDLLNVMNGVMILLGKPLGWKSIQKSVTAGGFMYDVFHLNYK